MFRFDDLRPGRRNSFSLPQPIRVHQTHRREGVVDILDTIEDEVRSGHWVAGFVTYEAAPGFDAALTVRPTPGTSIADLPLAWFGSFPGRGPAPPLRHVSDVRPRWESTTDPVEHAAAVETIHGAIRAGETYQVNLTHRLHTVMDDDVESFYGTLVRSQSGGYGALIDTGRWVVASASPELFFEWEHGRITTRPMKGTIVRGVSTETDIANRDTLLASEKDRAENLMIVDMVRNDLGRIARTGTVDVPALFTAEKYDTVWQMTSTVQAQPRHDVILSDVFGALFPSASITGAPKIATTRIIADLETTPRGVYCGAIGFGGPSAGGPVWAFNVAIRTVLYDRDSGIALYGTGGGITIDSDASAEYAESGWKMAVLTHTADFSLLETMRSEPGGIRLLDRHLARLVRSADYFDIPLDPGAVREALDTIGEPGRVRLTVDRTGAVGFTISAVPPPLSKPRVVVDDMPVSRSDPFLHHKTTNRTVYERAIARHPDADDVILINEEGRLTETTIANLVVEIDGVWYTPPLDDGCLAGVMRAELIDTGEVEERSLTEGDLARATGIARVNSLRGWETMVLTSDPSP